MSIVQALQIAWQHHVAGRDADAEAICRQVLATSPEHPGALNVLGVIVGDSGRYAQATELLGKVIAQFPGHAEFYCSRGEFYRRWGRSEEAIRDLQRAAELEPGRVAALNNLGLALAARGRLQEALAWHRAALRLAPADPQLHCNLALALSGSGHADEAIAEFRQAIALRPDLAEAYRGLATVLSDRGELDDARAALERAIALKPASADAHNTLGAVLKDQGRIKDALACFDKAMALDPENMAFQSNRIFVMHLDEQFSAREILEQCRSWDRRHAEPWCTEIVKYDNSPVEARRLRIGYVSADFREHPVTTFLLPLLKNHDCRSVEVICWSGVARGDDFTERVKTLADGWSDIAGLHDDEVAARVRAERVDILVDLTLHASQGRLGVFARKPAPVQVTWLGYAGTTGVATMDYRLTDWFLDPAGTEAFYSEKSVRLPSCFWCYQPLVEAPDVAPLPALAQGFVTFACLNNFAKVSDEALAAWVAILRALPNSRLLLHAHRGSHRDRVRDLFARAGIAVGRLEFVGFGPIREYYARHSQVDIALDTFPYNGGTTTCDALWMGVPVLTRRGQTAVGRAGVSLLNNVGLTDWIAATQDEYVETAVKMARDVNRLAALRAGLRERMIRSPLMDAKRFARDMEEAFQNMWHDWCRNRQP